MGWLEAIRRRTVKDGQMGYYGRSVAGELPESWAGGAPEP
jgi:hypothetical protein